MTQAGPSRPGSGKRFLLGGDGMIIITSGAALLTLMTGCTSEGTGPRGAIDITAKAEAELRRTGIFHLRPADGGEAQCVCLFDWEDNPGSESDPTATLRNLRAVCNSGQAPKARMESPEILNADQGLFVLFVERDGKTRAEYQWFSRRVPTFAAVTTLYAADCRKGSEAAITNRRESGQLYDVR